MARGLEAALVGAHLALPLLRLPAILFLLFLKNAVCELLPHAFHALHPLPSCALSGNTETSPLYAAARLWKILQERSREFNSLQLRQFRLFCRRDIAVVEDLIIGLEGADKVQEPALVGHVLLINAGVNEHLLLAESLELFKKLCLHGGLGHGSILISAYFGQNALPLITFRM